MKIISGYLRNRNIYRPAHIPPTQNMLRKAVFDIIGHDLEGLDVLELFAGSGAVSFEAVSLGARRVCLVEKDRKVVECIHSNIILLKLDCYEKTAVEVIEADVFMIVKKLGRNQIKFHMVFADPPYGFELGKKILKTLGAYDILHPNCFLLIQHDKYEKLPDTEGVLNRLTTRKYGTSFLSVYSKGAKVPFLKTGSAPS